MFVKQLYSAFMIRLIALLLLLVISGGSLGAEPLYPMLTRQAIDSLRTLLQNSKPDTNRVNLLLTLSDEFITRHEDQDEGLDSTYAYIGQADRLSRSLHFAAGQIRSQCTLGRYLGTTGKTKAAEHLIQKALVVYQKQKLRQQEAITWYFLGQIYARTKAELPKKINCYEQARVLFRQLGQVDKEAYLLKTIADMHYGQGNLALAQRELLQVVALYKSIHYPKLHYTYDLIRTVYHSMSNYDEALKYAQLAIESATVNKDSVDSGSFNLTLGILYAELKQWKSAKNYYQKALWYFEQSKNIDMVHVITNSICGGLIAYESPDKALAFCQQISRQYPAISPSSRYLQYLTLAECHLALKHFGTAETYYLQVLALGAGNTEVSNLAIGTYIRVGSFYVILKQYDKARTYLVHALNTLKQEGISRGAIAVHLQLFKVDSAQGNYSSAIKHYQTYKALSDSVFNEKKSQQIASLEIQYETKKKEQDIALLTRQNLVQQTSIQQKDFQRNSIIAGAILLTCLLGVSYNRFRLKQKSNQLLETKQLEINQKNQSLEQVLDQKEELLVEKEWMLKEIHHRVKNNLQVITSMLNAQSHSLSDPIVLAALRESQNRVHAMALIHQKLYQSDNLAKVNMPEYIHEIMDSLIGSFDQQDIIVGNVAVSEIQLDITLATPLGLIINEAVTNSLKYAFPENRSGTITVELHLIADQTYRLAIRDNGIGMPIGIDVERSRTLGLSMIRGLSRQIGGQLKIHLDSGVHIHLEFNPAKKAVSAV